MLHEPGSPLLARLLRAALRMNLRGSTRLTLTLARQLPALQGVPVHLADLPPVYIDLRMQPQHGWFKGDVGTDWEQSERAAMRRLVRPDDVAYDIGANLGFHTALLSTLAAHVIAFEPNVDVLPSLRRTVASLPNVELIDAGVGETAGAQTFYLPDNPTMASLRDFTATETMYGPARAVMINVVRVDDLIAAGLPAPNFIKCDVEGAELAVFRGAHALLDSERAPVILFEADADTARHFGLRARAAVEFLAGLAHPDYKFYAPRTDGLLVPLAGDEQHVNVVAVPKHRLESKLLACP